MTTEEQFLNEIQSIQFIDCVNKELFYQQFLNSPKKVDYEIYLETVSNSENENIEYTTTKFGVFRKDFMKNVNDKKIPDNCYIHDITKTDLFKKLNHINESFTHLIDHLHYSKNEIIYCEALSEFTADLLKFDDITIYNITNLLLDKDDPTSSIIMGLLLPNEREIKKLYGNTYQIKISETEIHDRKIKIRNRLREIIKEIANNLPRTSQETKFENFFVNLSDIQTINLKKYLCKSSKPDKELAIKLILIRDEFNILKNIAELNIIIKFLFPDCRIEAAAKYYRDENEKSRDLNNNIHRTHLKYYNELTELLK